METYLLRVFQREVAYACRAIIFGRQDMLSGGDERLWYGAQNIAVAAGNASKLLWGVDEPESTRRYDERQPLRASLEVDDVSPFHSDRKLRNRLEHIDERIEKWWRQSPSHNIADANIGPRSMVDFIDDKGLLRHFEPINGDLLVLGEEMNLALVLAEAQRVLPIAVRETERPWG